MAQKCIFLLFELPAWKLSDSQLEAILFSKVSNLLKINMNYHVKSGASSLKIRSDQLWSLLWFGGYFLFKMSVFFLNLFDCPYGLPCKIWTLQLKKWVSYAQFSYWLPFCFWRPFCFKMPANSLICSSLSTWNGNRWYLDWLEGIQVQLVVGIRGDTNYLIREGAKTGWVGYIFWATLAAHESSPHIRLQMITPHF